jgi:hypothetical protein
VGKTIKWRSFVEARDFVHKLQLKNNEEWVNWKKSKAKPEDIPATPERVYKDKGWNGLGDWIGTGTIAPFNRNYRLFKEARTFAHQLKLRNREDWKVWAKSKSRPDDIPVNPSGVYKEDGWVSWGDWLGTGKVANQNREYLPFKEARNFAHQLQLKNKQEWINWIKANEKLEDIPAYPDNSYMGKGWVSWGDWLGTGKVANQNREYLPFKEARNFAHQLQLKNKQEWISWIKANKKLEDIPAYPDDSYMGKGWVSWGDWLGTGTIA